MNKVELFCRHIAFCCRRLHDRTPEERDVAERLAAAVADPDAAAPARAAALSSLVELLFPGGSVSTFGMRHSDIKLTMNVYTDPALLDIRGALEALPTLPINGDDRQQQTAQATGTGRRAESLHQGLHQLGANRVKPGQPLARPLRRRGNGGVDARSTPVKSKGSLTASVSEPSCRGDWIRTSDLLNPIQAFCLQKSPENLAFHAKTTFQSLQELQWFYKVSRASATNLLQESPALSA